MKVHKFKNFEISLPQIVGPKRRRTKDGLDRPGDRYQSKSK